MVAKLIKPCASQGCCGMENNPIDFLTADTAAAKLILSKKPNAVSIIQELCGTVYQMPVSIFRLLADVWSHVKNEPKKPSWCIQTTVVMSFLQAFRDQSQANSLEFWRIMLVAPSLIKPITSKTEYELIVIKKRNLCGILSKMDSGETGSRTLDGEWMSAISAWEKIYGSSSLKRPLLLDSSVSSERIVLYIHGGAYCTMSAQTHRSLTHKISKSTKRRVLAVNYRLAPETKFPGALFDVVQSFLYLIDENDKHRFNPNNIIIMGDSAGGGLCLAMMLYLRDHSLPQPGGAVLLSPWVDLTFSYPSWKDASLYDYLPSNPSQLNTVNPALLYLDDQELIRHPYVSPIFADNFDNMPPILIQSGGCESLRDEICDLTDKIQKSKFTIVHHEIYEDMVHVFQAFPFRKSADAIESIGWWSKFGIPLITQWQEARSQEMT